jgi:hypothetical protein
VFVIEQLFLRLSSANEAAVPNAYIVNKTLGAKKVDPAILIHDRVVNGLRPSHLPDPV